MEERPDSRRAFCNGSYRLKIAVCLIVLVEIGVYLSGYGATAYSYERLAEPHAYLMAAMPDFTISATNSVSFNAGGNGESTITVTNITPDPGNYSIDLSYTVTPSTGLTVNISPGVLICWVQGCGSKSSGGTWTAGPSTARVSSSTPGSYIVNVTGTSDFSKHSAIIDVFVTDFSMKADPAALTVQTGRSTFSTITISAISGFTGTVALTTSVSPSGPTAFLDTASVTGSDDTRLTVSIGQGVAIGNYTIMVHGTSEGLSHYANVTLRVTSVEEASAAPGILGLGLLFYGMIGLVAAVAVAGLALLIRRQVKH